MVRFRGAGQSAFEAFYPLLPKIRKATPTLMRGMGGRVWHEPMPATACSAGLRCHRSRDTRLDRSLADDVEAVFVLIGVRRFAQSAENHRQRADSGDEKACGYEHDVNQARFAPLSVVWTLSHQQAILRFSIRESYQWGCPAQTNAGDGRISFRRLCLTEFYQHNPSDFCTVLFRP